MWSSFAPDTGSDRGEDWRGPRCQRGCVWCAASVPSSVGGGAACLTLRTRRHKGSCLPCYQVLLKLGEELLGFGERQSQLFDPLAVFLQHRHVVCRVASPIVRTDDQLHREPHVEPSSSGYF